MIDAWDDTRGGASPPRSVGAFLAACRGPFQRDIPPRLDALFDKLDDALYDLADKAGNDRLYARYFDAMRLFRTQSRNIKVIFLRQLQRAGEQTASGLVEPDSTLLDTFLDTLSVEDFALVEEADLEESLAVGNLVSKAENRYHRQLYELGRYLGQLLGRRELAPRSNPLGPVAICDAFSAALKPLQDIDLAIKLVVYKLFDKQVMDHLGGIYDQCLDLAVAHGLTAAPGPWRTAPGRPPAASPTSREEFPSPPGPSAPPSQEDIAAAVGRMPFNQLRSLLDQWRAPRPGTTGSPGDTVVVQTSELMAALSELQDAAQFARSGQIAPQEIRARLDGALQAHRSSRWGQTRSLGEIDEDTLELVLLLFQSIVQGGDLPDPIKALVGRLQIPLVKVALLDKTFFDNPDHPARRLLNRIADAAVGWAEKEERTPDSLYGRIERIVERIVGEFDRDLTLFVQLDAELAASLADEATRVRAVEAATCSVAAGRDRTALAGRKAQAAIDERLRRSPGVPAIVASMLNEGWRAVLSAAYLSGGGGSKEWRNAVAVIDRLLWSVQPKVTNEDRRDLLRSIPDLLRTLRARLAAIAFDQRLLARWFKELQTLHLAALRGTAPPQDAGQSGRGDRPALGAQGYAGQIGKGPATRAAPTPGTAGAPGRRAAGAESSELLRRLVPGCWVELVGDDARRARVKLAWISSDGQRLQFVDRQGREGPEMARDRLATLLEYGLANILRSGDDPPLVDRAIANLTRTLSH